MSEKPTQPLISRQEFTGSCYWKIQILLASVTARSKVFSTSFQFHFSLSISQLHFFWASPVFSRISSQVCNVISAVPHHILPKSSPARSSYMSLVLTSHISILEPKTVSQGMRCSIGQVWINGIYSLLEPIDGGFNTYGPTVIKVALKTDTGYCY